MVDVGAEHGGETFCPTSCDDGVVGGEVVAVGVEVQHGVDLGFEQGEVPGEFFELGVVVCVGVAVADLRGERLEGAAVGVEGGEVVEVEVWSAQDREPPLADGAVADAVDDNEADAVAPRGQAATGDPGHPVGSRLVAHPVHSPAVDPQGEVAESQLTPGVAHGGTEHRRPVAACRSSVATSVALSLL